MGRPRKSLDSKTTLAPEKAVVAYTSGAGRVPEDQWGNISNDLWQGINASLSERGALEQNLKDWNDLYEMRVDGTDWPWENASNVSIPMIPAQLDTAVAYIIGKTFVPRFYIVSGNTPEAAQSAHEVERYYNAELVRQRGQTTWYDQYLTWLHLSFRDGTAVMEVLWRKTESKRKVVTFDNETSDDGTPVIDMETGKARKKRTITEVETIDYDDVELQPVFLRDFLLIPAEATSIDQAAGVARAVWMYETELQAMVKKGTFNRKEVEDLLDYNPNGNSDIASDRQGTYDKTMGDQLTIGLAQGAQTSKYFRNRGPFKLWRVHTNQYDMNEDGVPEENILWIAERNQRMLGWMPDEYITQGRPFFSFAPYPRPGRFYGFSLCERLAPIQAEINGMWNGRNNLFDLILSPPLMYVEGEELDDNTQMWGPGARWTVSRTDAVKFMDPPQVPMEHFQNEALLNNYVDKLTGVSAPSMGAQSSGRRTAAEMKMQGAATTTRNDLISMRLRIVCRSIFAHVHALKLQYLDSDPEYSTGPGQKYTIERPVLAQDYQLDIAGSSDPLDVSTRRQENLALFQLLSAIPFIAQDQVKMYNLVRILVESFNRPDTNALIGTEQDAQQRQQAAEQQMQQMQQMQMLGAMLGKGGQPGGGGQKPGGQAGHAQPPPKPPIQ